VHPFEKAPPEVKELLGKRIKELGLRIEGSPVERLVHQLYRDLERKKLKHFRPICYLSDEWGCPSGEPVIGIPFYLADPQLASLEKAMNDLEDEREILAYLRHEAGHAFNYAYALYRTPEWRGLFGPFNRPYRDDYRPVPFSRRFVRHLAGWYGQKHPDEDFAETFAVWLTPRSGWRRRYKTWPAMRKLRYVERIARRLGDQEPVVGRGRFDLTVEQMDITLEEFYRRGTEKIKTAQDLALASDLADIFFRKDRRRKGIRPAAALIAENRVFLVDAVARWSGMSRPLAKDLVESLASSCESQQLWAETGHEARDLVALSACATTLAMNYLTRGSFVP
jgi:hypothetical protein